MTLYLVHMWSSVAISFSGHPFHACFYMYLNHVFLLLLLLLLRLRLFLFKWVWGFIKSQFLASAELASRLLCLSSP